MPIKEFDNGHPQTTDADSYNTTRIYHVWGMTDAELYAVAGLTDPIGNFSMQDLAEFAVRAVAPDTIAGSPVTQVESNDSNDADDWFEVTLTYSSSISGSSGGSTGIEPVAGASSVSVDISTQTINIQRAINTTIYTENGEPPKLVGGIEPTATGEDPKYRGADILIPVFGWTETHYLLDSSFTWQDLYDYAGKKNSTPFRGFAAGEVMLFGTSGGIRYDTEPLLWEMSYTFGATPNLANETIGLVTGVDKEGWDYLWVTYKEVSGTPTVNQVYVEQVSESINYAGLNIGVA